MMLANVTNKAKGFRMKKDRKMNLVYRYYDSRDVTNKVVTPVNTK
jgi:hypothetical protein